MKHFNFENLFGTACSVVVLISVSMLVGALVTLSQTDLTRLIQ